MKKILILLSLSFIIVNTSYTQINEALQKNIGMERPINVDQEAIWKFDIWYKGRLIKDKSGKFLPIGKYTIWDKEGVMRDDGESDDSGDILWFKSYFPDGSIGRTIQYDENSNITNVRWNSYHEYCERLPTPLKEGDDRFAKKSFEGKVRLYDNKELFNGSPEGVSFFNKNGELLNTWAYENYEALISKYTQKEKRESWKSALKRLDNYWTAFSAQCIKDGEDPNREGDYFSVSFQKGITEKDLQNAEKRLKITLPDSYKTFVLNEGLIKFGDDQHYIQEMLHPKNLQSITHKLDPENDGYFDSSYQIPMEKIKKIICFFENEADTQYDGWVAFDCIEQNNEEKNIIMSLGSKNIYEWEAKVGKTKDEKLNSMDQFISDFVDLIIKEREH